MYEIDLNLPKQIVADVLSNHEIHSVAFVGCGATMTVHPGQQHGQAERSDLHR